MAFVINSPYSHLYNPPSSSAAGLISYLDDSDVTLQVRSLQKLHQVIDLHWAEICEALPKIEALSEEPAFPAADLAAAVASKCFYHLQEYGDALRLALSAGKYLDISAKNEYIETIITVCIDQYKALRTAAPGEAPAVDPRMEGIVEQMFQRCYADGCFEQALGVALDTHRLDKVEEAVQRAIAAGAEGLLSYAFALCQSARKITPRDFRLSVIGVLVRGYAQLRVPDHWNVVFGLLFLDQPAQAAAVLDGLLRGSVEDSLLAFQIAFDLLETENQGFVLRLQQALDDLRGAGAGESAAAPSEEEATHADRLVKMRRILSEGLDIDLALSFLFKASQADLGALRDIKQAIEGRSNVLHNATVLTHAFLHAGTTRDSFLRENLEWLGRAKNWAKFSTVASIGVVHKGHVHESLNLLRPYLPQGGSSASPYSEAGALYALGLIHANKGGAGDSATITYLAEALRNGGTNETVQHGACLGIGLAAMATGREDLFEALRAVLFTDSAVAGEGAALGMGLLLLGQSESALAQAVLPDLLNYLHDTQHEKIIRALALAVAMMVYGKEESADVLIDQLARDRDPIVRYGAMFAVALAYCGTGENSQIRRLLHVAVSDVSDDVRRAAVMALGFLLTGAPETVPRLVQLLAESFNPHVRYGAALAVGIACAGTALKEATDLLAPLLEDGVDFVRQGALMASALVLQQAAEARCPAVRKFKDRLTAVITDKHQPLLAKQGAILAAGVLEAGGGNVVVSMQSRAGFVKMGSAVGMTLFLQHWYWYPLLPLLSLAFQPTMVVGLNADLALPAAFQLVCNAPPSMFAYNRPEEKREEREKVVATAVLSTTARAKAREARKEAKKLGRQGSFEGEGPALERVPSHLSTASYLSLDAEKTAAALEAKPKKAKEPTSFTLSNPSRLVAAQQRFLSLPSGQRYRPVRAGCVPMGVVLLVDADPSAPEDEVVRVDRLTLGQEDDAAPFEPFEWDPNDE